MGVREMLNRNRGVAVGVTVALLASAIISSIFMHEQSPPAPKTRAYYTTDDGSTYFVDTIDKVVPFNHDGKPAYRAYVYKCRDEKPFVAYLERYTEEGRVRLTNLRAGPSDTSVAKQIAQLQSEQAEVKKPRDIVWVSAKSSSAADVINVKCPGGGSDTVVVLP